MALYYVTIYIYLILNIVSYFLFYLNIYIDKVFNFLILFFNCFPKIFNKFKYTFEHVLKFYFFIKT